MPIRRGLISAGGVCAEVAAVALVGDLAASCDCAGCGAHFQNGPICRRLSGAEAEDGKLRQAIQESYRRVNPKGAVVDVEKQLNRQLAEYGAGSQSQLFTPSLVSLLGAASSVSGIKLSSVNYSGGREIRINIAAPDFQSVEQLREQLGKYSLSAELENSNARSEGVVARLRVELK